MGETCMANPEAVDYDCFFSNRTIRGMLSVRKLLSSASLLEFAKASHWESIATNTEYYKLAL